MNATVGHVGFTGTRHGMTERQKGGVFNRLARFQWLHHGDCLGADRETHFAARKLRLMIFLHPPIETRWRAFCIANAANEPKDYITRNHDIIDAVEELIAAPAAMQEEQRPGTWATVRYARQQGRLITIVYPDGSLEFTP